MFDLLIFYLLALANGFLADREEIFERKEDTRLAELPKLFFDKFDTFRYRVKKEPFLLKEWLRLFFKGKEASGAKPYGQANRCRTARSKRLWENCLSNKAILSLGLEGKDVR